MNLTLIDLIILALSTVRITTFLVKEDGPYMLGERIRHIIGIRYDESSNKFGKNELARMFMCTWCASMWVGLFLWALFLIGFPSWIFVPFVLSEAMLILDH